MRSSVSRLKLLGRVDTAMHSTEYSKQKEPLTSGSFYWLVKVNKLAFAYAKAKTLLHYNRLRLALTILAQHDLIRSALKYLVNSDAISVLCSILSYDKGSH